MYSDIFLFDLDVRRIHLEGLRFVGQIGWPGWDFDQSRAARGSERGPVPARGTQSPEEAGPDGPRGTASHGGAQDTAGNYRGGTATLWVLIAPVTHTGLCGMHRIKWMCCVVCNKVKWKQAYETVVQSELLYKSTFIFSPI